MRRTEVLRFHPEVETMTFDKAKSPIFGFTCRVLYAFRTTTGRILYQTVDCFRHPYYSSAIIMN